MDVWLVRHGETEWNHNGRVQGWTDVPLNSVGKLQARRLADYLRDTSFTHIYSSDLSRASDTASEVAKQSELSITSTSELREQCFGQAEGLSREEKQRRFPNGCPDGETNDQVQNRIVTFLQSLAERHPGGNILVATHGGVIRSILTWLNQPPLFIKNTSITRIREADGKFQVLSINQTPHLIDEDRLDATHIS